MYTSLLNNAWRLYTPVDNSRVAMTNLQNEPGKGTTILTQTPATSPCFHHVELIIDKYKVGQDLQVDYLGTWQDGTGTAQFLACNAYDSYETLELHEGGSAI